MSVGEPHIGTSICCPVCRDIEVEARLLDSSRNLELPGSNVWRCFLQMLHSASCLMPSVLTLSLENQKTKPTQCGWGEGEEVHKVKKGIQVNCIGLCPKYMMKFANKFQTFCCFFGDVRLSLQKRRVELNRKKVLRLLMQTAELFSSQKSCIPAEVGDCRPHHNLPTLCVSIGTFFLI